MSDRKFELFDRRFIKLNRRIKQHFNVDNCNDVITEYIMSDRNLALEIREIILAKWNKRRLERKLIQKNYKKKVSKI